MADKKNRYPGSKPFSASDKNMFFGRDLDIEQIEKVAKVEKLLVLFGKSGLGKSSILNAGISPHFEGLGQYRVFHVRFGNQQGQLATPVEKTSSAIHSQLQGDSFFKSLQMTDTSPWLDLKTLQIQDGGKKTYLLIFDQFEELFTYSQKEIQEFTNCLAQLVSENVPKNRIEEFESRIPLAPGLLNEQEQELFYEPIDFRAILSIRSDKMSLLNKLKTRIPDILKVSYELLPLRRMQAEEAILNPAELSGEAFISPPFFYKDEAIDKILDYLTQGGEKEIETFQLQVVCQHIENKIVIANQDLEIDANDLGDIDDIYLNFYSYQIQKFDEAEQRLISQLIEDDMIFEAEERRISIYEGQIFDKGISRELLQRLTDTHVIRAEPHASGGFSYEISHDTMVAPILISKRKRLDKEQETLMVEEVKRKAAQQNMNLVYTLLAIIALSGIAFLFYESRVVVDERDELKRTREELVAEQVRTQELMLERERLGLEEKASLLQQRDSMIILLEEERNKYDELIKGYEEAEAAGEEGNLRSAQAEIVRQKNTLLIAKNRELRNKLQAHLSRVGFITINFSETLELMLSDGDDYRALKRVNDRYKAYLRGLEAEVEALNRE